MHEVKFSAVVLAGGYSSRMGRDKAWLNAGETTFIGRAVDTCRSLSPRELFVSGRPGEDYSALECPVLLDLDPGQGPLGGIERALQAAAAPLVLVLAVDLPCMTAEFLRKLLNRCDRLTGCVPKLEEQLEPLAAIYPARCHVFAMDLLRRGRRSVREFADACLLERALKIVKVPRKEAGVFANCNTEQDLAALLR